MALGSVYRAKSCTSGFLSGKVPKLICPRSDTFAVACKATLQNAPKIEENANVSFLSQTIRRALVVLLSVIH